MRRYAVENEELFRDLLALDGDQEYNLLDILQFAVRSKQNDSKFQEYIHKQLEIAVENGIETRIEKVEGNDSRFLYSLIYSFLIPTKKGIKVHEVVYKKLNDDFLIHMLEYLGGDVFIGNENSSAENDDQFWKRESVTKVIQTLNELTSSRKLGLHDYKRSLIYAGLAFNAFWCNEPDLLRRFILLNCTKIKILPFLYINSNHEVEVEYKLCNTVNYSDIVKEIVEEVYKGFRDKEYTTHKGIGYNMGCRIYGDFDIWHEDSLEISDNRAYDRIIRTLDMSTIKDDIENRFIL